MKKLLFILLLFCSSVSNAQDSIFYMLVGTYTNVPSKSEGIYVYQFNSKNGAVNFVSKIVGIANPSYLIFSNDQKYVYAVNENEGDSSASVSSFSFDKTKGELQFLNKQPSGGDDPCYLDIDSSGKNIVVANYSGGNFSLFKTNADGSLQPYTQLIVHDGNGINKKRQQMPHPHCTIFSPDEKYLFVADLGNDRLYHYTFNPNDSIKPVGDMNVPYYKIPDGNGPRHLVFSSDKKFAYLISEMAGSVMAYKYNNSNGSLKQIQTIQSDTTSFKGDKSSAEIAISPDGKFLYSSNREPANDIAIYKIKNNGKLVAIGHQAVGKHPRFFMIDPTGNFLLVANRDSNNIQVFGINKNIGLLKNTNMNINIDMPVCIKMIPAN